VLDPQLGDRVFPIVVHIHGDPNVTEESLTTYEIGYTGVFGRTTASGGIYLSDLHDPLANIPGQPYTSAHPPPGWPLPAFLLDELALPSEIVFANLGPVRNRGFELSLSHRFSGGVAAFANYSWQDDPEPLESESPIPPYPPGALNVPSHHRLNLGLTLDRGRFLGGVTLNYTSEAFWADVLVPPYWGPTPDHTLLGVSVGVRLAGTRLTLLLKGTNLIDEGVQYHVFGDIAKRSVMLQAKVRF
jgi:outer membrane receptor protein involved in Fe transport